MHSIIAKCPCSLVFVLSFFVNLLALTVPLYLLHIYDHVLSSRSIDTLMMLTLIVIVALAVHATLEALRRAILARIGIWLDDRLQLPVLAAAVRFRLCAATRPRRRRPGAILAACAPSSAARACTALFDLPWTPIFMLAMVLVHPLLGPIGLRRPAVLFGLAMLNELATRKPYSPAPAPLGPESAAPLRDPPAQCRSDQRHGDAARRGPSPARRSVPGKAGSAFRRRCAARQSSPSLASSGCFAQVIVMASAAWLVILHDVSPAAIFATSILLGRSLAPVESAIGTWKAVTTVRLGYGRLRKIMASAPQARKVMAAAPPQRAAVHRTGHLPAAGREHGGIAPADLRGQPRARSWA